MPDIGFSEILLVFILGLIILGPEKLPRVAAQVGKWIGRARAMARQFREQLEEEVTVEENRRKEGERRKAEAAQSQAGSQSGSQSSSGESPGAGAGPGTAGAAGVGGAAGVAGAPGAAGSASDAGAGHDGTQPTAPWIGATVQPEPEIPPEFQSPPSGTEPTSAGAAASPETSGGSSTGAAVGSHDTHYAPPGEEIASNESGHVDLTHEAWPYNGPAPPPEVDAVFHDALKQQAAVVSSGSRDPSPESKPSETNTNERAPGGAGRATHERPT